MKRVLAHAAACPLDGIQECVLVYYTIMNILDQGYAFKEIMRYTDMKHYVLNGHAVSNYDY